VHNFVLYSRIRVLYSGPVACATTSPDLKIQVAEFWNSEPCGTRYLGGNLNFEEQSATRYRIEPHIPVFAGFASACGLKVLEIGVGLGADYEQWLKAGAIATGIDLSAKSLELTKRRCEAAGFKPDLQQADAENLPFPANSFDIVYSYGVMHHSPNTARCVREAWRVLKPGGEARIMLYHHVSLTGIMLWLRYGVWRGQSIRQCVYDHLESPGTKTFTRAEALAMMRDFENVSLQQVFSPGDLLLHRPSARFQGRICKSLWKFFPRTLISRCGRRHGLFLLIAGAKPENTLVGKSMPSWN